MQKHKNTWKKLQNINETSDKTTDMLRFLS